MGHIKAIADKELSHQKKMVGQVGRGVLSPPPPPLLGFFSSRVSAHGQGLSREFSRTQKILHPICLQKRAVGTSVPKIETSNKRASPILFEILKIRKCKKNILRLHTTDPA